MSAPFVGYPEREPGSCSECGGHPDDCSCRLPMRVQVCRGGVLFGEAIVELHMVSTFSPHNVFGRLGGVVIQRADLPRTWDVRVGGEISETRRKAS